jgi:phenylacetate-CoA ligase
MAIEDLLHPLLGYYFSTPDWFRNSVGRIYSWIPDTVSRGMHYQRFLREASLRDPDEIRRLAEKKLARTLAWAFDTVPAYAQYRKLTGDLDAPYDVLRALPVVSKDDIKRDLPRFLSTGVSAQRRLKTATGGSTSTPMVFFLHKGITRTREYAYMEDFHRRVGLTSRDVILAIRGRTVPSAKQPGGKRWMYEPIKRQLILSSDHLERAHMPAYLEAIRTWKPTYIQAYPSGAYPLARWLKENPAPDITRRIKGVLLYSENVFDYHVALLKEVFGCPVLKHYGQSERVLMAASLPDDDRYFFWPHYGHVELVDDAGIPITRPGVLGELVGTAFDNEAMPFIRYRTGDLAVLDDKPHPLFPGWPVVRSIEGRRQEFIVCRDNRAIAVCGMGAAHSPDLAKIDSMQFEQYRPGHIIIKAVAPRPLSPEESARIVRAMEDKTQGGCTAELVQVDAIPRTTRGKHKLLVQHLDVSQYLGVPVQS